MGDWCGSVIWPEPIGKKERVRRRGRNKAVLVWVRFEPSEKVYFFVKERCFFS